VLVHEYFRKIFATCATILLYSKNVAMISSVETMTSPINSTGVRDKRAKFVELANKRVNRAIKDLELIANLANKHNYEYDEEQARKIIKALQHELDLVKQSFVSGCLGKQTIFEL